MTKELVSVIMPTCNRYETAVENVMNISSGQDYENFEIIVCDDSDKDYFHKHSKNFRQQLSNISNTKYFYVARFNVDEKKDYGIARARNFGVIESQGEFLVFLDDRITPASTDMITVFVNALKKSKKKWFFGDKGAHKESFVENCSAIRRQELIIAGMFCERIDKYGGMTRELIARFSNQGFEFKYLPTALAKQVSKSTGWDKKEKQLTESRILLDKMYG